MEKGKQGNVAVLVTHTENYETYWLLPKVWSESKGQYVNDETKKDIPIKGDDVAGLILSLSNLLHGE